MRGCMLIVVSLSLAFVAGCSAEPDFDEKFDQQARDLAEQARKIESEANAQLAAAREAEKAAAELDGTRPAAAK